MYTLKKFPLGKRPIVCFGQCPLILAQSLLVWPSRPLYLVHRCRQNRPLSCAFDVALLSQLSCSRGKMDCRWQTKKSTAV